MNADEPAASLEDDDAACAAFIAAMQTPAAYAAMHPVDGPVRCIETHVSWVFLAGAFAYKVKKPLRLRFLDYSTAERRATFCHEELRLNRRYAPELYLDVVPIAGRPDAPRVGDASAPAFEHALRSFQFEPRDELAHLLEAGDITQAEIASLGADLANLQATAAPAPTSSPYGAAQALHRVTHDNFAEIAHGLGADPRAHGALCELQARLERIFDPLRERMEARRRAGYVRECHGDLHCGNVVRWRGRLVAFDALEFDPALRFIDVTSDLAFLSMDLAARGRPDLRRALIDAWAVTSGDYTAMRLLPYYEAYRALVRAKVSVLRGLQNAEASFESGCHATRYLDWAMQRTVVRAPTLIVMVGLSGSGKTWLARRIAPRLDALHVRSDVERKRLAGLGPLESSRSAPDAGIYTTDFNDRTYARLRDCARDCLLGAMNVVIDAASLRRDERAAFIHVAAECGARLRFVHCHAPLAVLRERVAARAQSRDDASEATVALLDRQPGYWEPLTGAEAAITLEVDTSRHESIETALASLDATVQVDRTRSSPQPA